MTAPTSADNTKRLRNKAFLFSQPHHVTEMHTIAHPNETRPLNYQTHTFSKIKRNTKNHRWQVLSKKTLSYNPEGSINRSNILECNLTV